MPKKMGGNDKAVAARERKAAIASQKKAVAAQAAEDAVWADNTQPTKAEAKRAQAEAAREAAKARKQEDRAMAAAEDDAMTKLASKKKVGKAGGKKGAPPKMSVFMIQQAKAAREEKERKNAKKAAKAAEREAQALHVNRNRELGVEEAAGSGIDGALAAVMAAAAGAAAGSKGANAAAEGRMTYKVFEANRLPDLKSEKPGLMGSQYRDMCKKEWKRSPMNPNNQPK